jgi:hypothetical protein
METKGSETFYWPLKRKPSQLLFFCGSVPDEVLLCGDGGDDARLDSAVILSPEYLKGALVAPVKVPRVGHEPVGRAALHAPAEDPGARFTNC